MLVGGRHTRPPTAIYGRELAVGTNTTGPQSKMLLFAQHGNNDRDFVKRQRIVNEPIVKEALVDYPGSYRELEKEPYFRRIVRRHTYVTVKEVCACRSQTRDAPTKCRREFAITTYDEPGR